MSLRYASRICLSYGARAVQAVKDQGGKLDGGLKSLQTKREAGVRNQVRRLSGAVDSAKRMSAEEMKKREAEKVEQVYQLICWGPK